MEKKVLDEATRQALLGLSPFSLNSTIDFVPASYKIKNKEGQYVIPEDLWPTFTIRPWTKVENEAVKKSLSKASTLTGDQANKAEAESKESVRKAIKGWSNLIDAGTCEEIEFESDAEGGASKVAFEQFPAALISDLLNKCCSVSGLLDMERLGLRS